MTKILRPTTQSAHQVPAAPEVLGRGEAAQSRPDLLDEEEGDIVVDVPASGSVSNRSAGDEDDSHVEVLDPGEGEIPLDFGEDPEIDNSISKLLDSVQKRLDGDAQEDVAEPEPKIADLAPARIGSRDLVPLDALSLYLREISKYPALSREEEHELAVKYYSKKDIEAAYKLIASNLWLVVKVARDYERATRSLLDLVQEGNIGLMEAVKNFDPFRGVRLPSYAVWWIKAYIVRYLIANWRMVKIGTTQAQRKLFFNLKKEREKLERAGFAPTAKAIAEKLDVRESDVVEMEQRLGGSDLSVDAPLSADSDSNLLALLPAPGESAEDLLSRKQMRALFEKSLREFASTLKPKELVIFTERVLAEEKATLQELSEKLGVSRERIRQLENRVRDNLKEYVEKTLGSTLEGIEI